LKYFFFENFENFTVYNAIFAYSTDSSTGMTAGCDLYHQIQRIRNPHKNFSLGCGHPSALSWRKL